MADFVNDTYEDGATLAAKGYTSITNLSNISGEGLTGSTWGVRGTGTANQKSNARANLPTGMTGRNFLIEFDIDHADANGSFRTTLDLLSATVGLNNFFFSIDSDQFDGALDGKISFWSYETPGFGGVTPVWESALGLVDIGVSQRWSLCGELSSASGVADASLTFKIDGVEQISLTNLVLWGHAANGGQVAEIRICPHGRFDNLRVADDGCAIAPVEVEDDAEICGCTAPASETADTVAAGGGQGAGATLLQTPSIGAVIGCVGGGLVPIEYDIAHSEVWWGN